MGQSQNSVFYVTIKVSPEGTTLSPVILFSPSGGEGGWSEREKLEIISVPPKGGMSLELAPVLMADGGHFLPSCSYDVLKIRMIVFTSRPLDATLVLSGSSSLKSDTLRVPALSQASCVGMGNVSCPQEDCSQGKAANTTHYDKILVHAAINQGTPRPSSNTKEHRGRVLNNLSWLIRNK